MTKWFSLISIKMSKSNYRAYLDYKRKVNFCWIAMKGGNV